VCFNKVAVQSVQGCLLAVLFAIPVPALAQTAASAHPPRYFVDFSVAGVADSLAHERAFKVPFVIFGENASVGADYPQPGRARGVPIDAGGGFMFNKYLGVGASLSRTRYEHAVGLSATIPHPLFVNRPASATGVEDHALEAREQAVHVFVTFVPLHRDRFELRVTGGPSFFSYKADMVENVLYTQDYSESTPANSIVIDGAANQEVDAGGTGFHIGGDFTYFLTRLIGIGLGMRYSQGVVTLDREPLSQLSQQFRVGNTLVFLGVRLRIGG